jgi:hypothetical protein
VRLPVVAAAALLSLLAAAPRPTLAAESAKDPAAALFAERADRWRDAYDRRVRDRVVLLKELAKTPKAAEAVQLRFKEAADFHRSQLALLNGLTGNQEQAVKDKVITKAVFENHYARLTRVLDERLLHLWGNVLPTRWNLELAELPKDRRPSGYPFEVYPSEKEYQRYRSKDFTPVYDRATKTMSVVKPEEAFK